MLQLTLPAYDVWDLSSPEAVIILPNGHRTLARIKHLNTAADLKRKIELDFGLPYELQKIRLTGCAQVIPDWTLVSQVDTEILLRVDERWCSFVNSLLRGRIERVSELLEGVGGGVLFENHLYVGLFLAVGTLNERLWKYFFKRRPNICKRTASGRNLLHVAVHARNFDCIERILQVTGDILISSKDNIDKSPLDLAKDICFFEALEIFRRYKELNEPGEKVMGKMSLSYIGHQELESNNAKTSTSCYVITGSNENQHKSATRQVSPIFSRDKSQLLDREKACNSLNRCNSGSNLCTNNAASLPSITSVKNLNTTLAVAVPGKQKQSADANRRQISVSTPVSPVQNRRNSEVLAFSPGVQQNSMPSDCEDQSFGKVLNNDSEQTIIGKQPLGMQQSVIGTASEKLEQLERPHQLEVSDSCLELPGKMRAENQKENRRQVRSRSVACLTPDQLSSINEINRTKKPWNDWRRVSLFAGNEKDLLLHQFQAARESERKKSFDSWLAEKIVMREELTAKMTEEEQMKKLERQKSVEERRSRCKSYNRWLADKVSEAEELKEAEKKKESEKRTLEDKMQIRRAEAERKYEKWMREKYEEELKKEEELQRLMEKKWKMKEKAQMRRKSTSARITGIKQKSSKKNSLPLL